MINGCHDSEPACEVELNILTGSSKVKARADPERHSAHIDPE